MKIERAHTLYSPALRYFVAVAEHGSIREAARQLNIASSAVNRQILGLEEEFGLQFFERVGRRLRLSEAGELLLRHARSVLTDFDVLSEQIGDLRGLKQGVVRVTSVESVADAILPQLTHSFQELYPGITLEVTITSSLKVARLISTAKAHIGFTFNPPDHEALKEIASWELKVGAVVAPGHPLTRSKSCSFADCLDYPLALPAGNLSLARILEVPLTRLKCRPAAFIKANSLRFMRNLARNGHHVTFQTILGIEQERQAGLLAYVNLSDADIPRDRLVVLTNATHELSLAPSTFARHANKALTAYLANS
ncbi:LysR family transcriptional regulator [Kiloniella laminariae]|uniref:LysR family transcriptional regulator n=1 Tax=Kiloniella laminariae TaxID=454162 RepID=A0ABT4LGP0_9PROT|nr:LysR family transcriptional regulator [Kiloniella laminariae]MCZ4280266.1 LysR family transcriptional regulator [Kiloniella laminariae]